MTCICRFSVLLILDYQDSLLAALTAVHASSGSHVAPGPWHQLVCSFLQMTPFSSSTGARCNPVLTQNSTTAAGDGNTAATSCTAADLSDTSAEMATAG